MADLDNKLKENVPGKYYVDDQCIACDVCRQILPDVFGNTDDDLSFIKRQPTEDEIEKMEEAIGSCPVNAIGDDGK